MIKWSPSLYKPRIYFPTRPTIVDYIHRPKIFSRDNYVENIPRRRSEDLLSALQNERKDLEADQRAQKINEKKLSYDSYDFLAHGGDPRSPEEHKVAEEMDRGGFLHPYFQPTDLPHLTLRYRLKKQQETIRELERQCKWVGYPTRAMVRIAEASLQRNHREELSIAKSREALENETGITAEQRLDAYMLGDDRIFPLWARMLPVRIRDRVLYGGIGLTEYDENTRLHLLRLPADRSRVVWEREKKKRREELGTLQTSITAKEWKILTTGRKEHKWIYIKRLQRKRNIHILELHKSENGQWPTQCEDPIAPLNVVARHVLARVPTGGMWPLDASTADRALEQQEKERKLTAFASPASPSEFSTTPSHPMFKALFEKMDRNLAEDFRQKPLMRLSRKNFKKRWSAVLHGHCDEFGRRLKPRGRPFARTKALASFTEFAMEREQLNLPAITRRPKGEFPVALWPAQYKEGRASYPVGMPSPKRFML